MKKIIALFLSLCMVFALVACGGAPAATPQPAKPDDAICAYLADFDAIVSVIDHDSFAEYSVDARTSINELLSANYSYEILDITTEDEKANISVKISNKNFGFAKKLNDNNKNYDF